MATLLRRLLLLFRHCNHFLPSAPACCHALFAVLCGMLQFTAPLPFLILPCLLLATRLFLAFAADLESPITPPATLT